MASKRKQSNFESSEDISSESDNEAETSSKKKHTGSAKYKVAFKSKWKALHPIQAVKSDIYKFNCLPCGKNLKCDHQGLKDVEDHCETETHLKNYSTWKKQPLLSFFKTDNNFEKKVLNAEVMVTNFIVQHNLPIATADHLGHLFKNIFPDSKIASSYSCAKTKTFAILNEALAPDCHNYIVEHCKTHAYSVGHDGSNDTGVAKMNPVSIRIFDINRSKVVTDHFCNMYITEGEDCCKAFKIFESIEKCFEEDKMPWSNCVSLSVDNTNSMVGRHNSVASHFLGKNPATFIAGCPCHLAHIAASHANESFSNYVNLSVEDVCVDCYYWFDKSTKRKGKLTEYFEFCNQEYQSVLKHLSVRWLSLERCMERILKKLPSLKAYFQSEDFQDARFQRLNDWFANPLLEPSLLFNAAAISIFTSFNRLLQREEPTIHILMASMEHLGRKIANRIIKPEVMQSVSSVTKIDLNDDAIFIDARSVFLGGTTKFTLNRLRNDGSISENDYMKVHYGALHYFKDALKYILEKFPINNEVICNSIWIDVEKRLQAKWENVEFFLEKFASVSFMDTIKQDNLYEEFVDFRTLSDDDIGQTAWTEAKVIDGEDEDGNALLHYRVDVLWYHIAQLKVPETSLCRFKYLPLLAEIVLVIPHSNAGQERLFSVVRKNKTDSRSSLKLDGSLSSILAMKCHNPEAVTPCYKWRPDEDLLQKSKKATKVYNDKHKKQ